MNPEQKIKASDWNSRQRRHAEELIASGKMPPLEAVLAAVFSTRVKFVPLIRSARKDDEAKATAQKAYALEVEVKDKTTGKHKPRKRARP